MNRDHLEEFLEWLCDQHLLVAENENDQRTIQEIVDEFLGTK